MEYWMAIEIEDEARLDRNHFSVAKLSDPDDAVAYWLTRPVDERMQALERLRMAFYGYTETSGRLQRVLEVARLEPR